MILTDIPTNTKTDGYRVMVSWSFWSLDRTDFSTSVPSKSHHFRKVCRPGDCPDSPEECELEGDLMIEAFSDSDDCQATIHIDNGCPLLETGQSTSSSSVGKKDEDKGFFDSLVASFPYPSKKAPTPPPLLPLPPSVCCDAENPVVRVSVERKRKTGCGVVQSSLDACTDAILGCPRPSGGCVEVEEVVEDPPECKVVVDVDLATGEAKLAPECQPKKLSLVGDACADVMGGNDCSQKKRRKLTCLKPEIELRIKDGDVCVDEKDVNVEVEGEKRMARKCEGKTEGKEKGRK